jgi:chromosome segregation ATPase
MGGDLRRVGWWQRCGLAAWGLVALSVLPVPAEPQSTALDRRPDANRIAVELDDARAAAARAERALDAERQRARELAERALDGDGAGGTAEGEALERRVSEIADARTRLAAAERDLGNKSSRMIMLEATLAKLAAEQKRVVDELRARAHDLEQTSARAAKTEASLGHAHAERKRLTRRLGGLEREIASARQAKQRAGTRAEKPRNRSRTRATQFHGASKGAPKSRQIANRRAKSKRQPAPTGIRDGRRTARNAPHHVPSRVVRAERRGDAMTSPRKANGGSPRR